jgi:hypothetical protein
MTDTIAILNRIGLTLGFMGSLFLAVGILGQDRIRRFEKLCRQTLKILVNPYKFIKTAYAREQPSWFLLILLPLSLLFNALPIILEKHVVSMPVVSTAWRWAQWCWGLPGWLYFVILLPSSFGIGIVLGQLIHSKTPRKHRWVFSILILFFVISLAPAIPLIFIWWFLCWFLLLVLTSVVFWIFTLPVQIGFAFQERFGLSSAFEPAGIVLLMLAFLLQLIATF